LIAYDRWELWKAVCMWKLAGVKTSRGKEISKMNAFKHGMYDAEMKAASHFIAQSKKTLKNLLQT